MKVIKVVTAAFEGWLEKEGMFCFEVIGATNNSLVTVKQPGRVDFVYICRRCGKKIGRDSGQFPIHLRYQE